MDLSQKRSVDNRLKLVSADCVSYPLRPPTNVALSEWVVLLHGLFATQRSMSKLERHLTASGYNVVNWRYRTWWYTTEHNLQRLKQALAGLQNDSQVESIHFVTHSMGGILARGALHAGDVRKVKRIVMLAPPNCGSRLTRFSLGPFAYCVPSLADLSEAPDSLPNRLTIADCIEVGIIAAMRDFVVPVANTFLPNQLDHCVMPTTHYRLPMDKHVIKKVLSFLETGSFSPLAKTVKTARAA